jgi:hypothetical protein
MNAAISRFTDEERKALAAFDAMVDAEPLNREEIALSKFANDILFPERQRKRTRIQADEAYRQKANVRAKAWYEANKAHAAERKREWYQTNKAWIAQQQREHRQRKKEALLAAAG